MKKVIWGLVCLFCFGAGVYVWKVVNTGRNLERFAGQQARPDFATQRVLVEVGDTAISRDDLEFEYRLLTFGLAEAKELTPIPDLGERMEEELHPLKDNIVSALVERKMLYKLVEQDKSFDLTDSARYVGCLEEWMRLLRQDNQLLAQGDDRERLKTRLCEQSILEQYLQEKVYGGIQVGEKESLEYFKNHRGEFHIPATVQIRQIVLAKEKQAKDIRRQVNRGNFADLAAAHSITPEAQDGGVLGPFSMGGGMPRFFDVAFSMKPGQISDILKSTYGFHIIMLEQKSEERELSFQEALPKIRALLERKEQERAYQKWVDLALHSIDVNTPKYYR